VKLNEIAKTYDKDGEKKEGRELLQQIHALRQLLSVKATSHPGSKRGYIHPVRGMGNTARAVTRTRRAAPWAFRSNRTNRPAGPRDH
jgi:hypothetical protein